MRVVESESKETLRKIQYGMNQIAFTQQRRGRVFLLKIRLLERLFDVERCDRQRANHLEGQEADDVGSVVVGF